MSVANVVQGRDHLAVSVDEAARLLGFPATSSTTSCAGASCSPSGSAAASSSPCAPWNSCSNGPEHRAPFGEASDDANSPITAAASRSATSR